MIQLPNDYFITADEFQYILAGKRKTSTAGKTHDGVGYYSTAVNALEGYTKRFMRKQLQITDTSISDAYAAFKRISDDLKNCYPLKCKKPYLKR